MRDPVATKTKSPVIKKEAAFNLSGVTSVLLLHHVKRFPCREWHGKELPQNHRIAGVGRDIKRSSLISPQY